AEDDPFSRNVLEHFGARNHRREHQLVSSTHAEAAGEQQSTHERHLLERDLAQGTVGEGRRRIDRNLVPRAEFVGLEVRVETLHATSQMRCITRAYTSAILTSPSMS